MIRVKGCIFDLDGVVVDTAKYHFQAWRDLAIGLGFSLSVQDNEKLKGVSRSESLEILLNLGKMSLSDHRKQELMDEKNRAYLAYVDKMTSEEVLSGAIEFINELRSLNIKIALGSASKNAKRILEKTEITDLFDVVVDGNMVVKSKPDPEIFLKAAELLEVAPSEALVFEDALSGIEAAHAAGIKTIGVGSAEALKIANATIESLKEANVSSIFKVIGVTTATES